MRRRRAAIYGGTFDPVHNGHIEVARRVQKLFALDEVIFVPACVPPHKRDAGISSAFHRFAMLALATEDDDRLRVSTIELDQPDRPYAVETVARLKHELGNDCRLFFLMGADSWSEIETWREWNRLTEMANLIVVTRPGYEVQLNQHNSVVQTLDIRGWETARVSDAVNERSGLRVVYFSDVAMVDVSATKIREAVRMKDVENLNRLVPPAVADYIIKYELYRN